MNIRSSNSSSCCCCCLETRSIGNARQHGHTHTHTHTCAAHHPSHSPSRPGPATLHADRQTDTGSGCSVLQPSSIRGLATPWTYFLHLSLSSVILTDSSTGSPVHVLMLSIQAVRGLPRLRAPGIFRVYTRTVSFHRHGRERDCAWNTLTAVPGIDLQNILRFIIRLSEVCRKIEFR